MNQPHHEQLARDLLANFRIYREQRSPSVEGALRLLEQRRDLFIPSTSEPDRLTDTALKMVWFWPDKTSVAGHNLTSFQHFSTYQMVSGLILQAEGYCWDRDTSLGWIDKVVDFPVKLFSSHIEEQDTDTWFGPGVLSQSPMAQFAQRKGSFSKFVFPSAVEVASYYAKVAAQTKDPELWIKCLGLVLHMTADMCVPHHVKGWLLNGHQEWEDACERHWNDYRNAVQVYSRLPWLDSVLRDSPADTLVKSTLSTAQLTTTTWLDSPYNHEQAAAGNLDFATAVDICHLVIALCIKVVEAMANQRQQSWT